MLFLLKFHLSDNVCIVGVINKPGAQDVGYSHANLLLVSKGKVVWLNCLQTGTKTFGTVDC